MHIYTKLSLLTATLVLSSCQMPALSGLKVSTQNLSSCLIYQRCDVTGTLQIQGSGDYTAYSVMGADNKCFSLLMSKSQRVALNQFRDKPVKISGLSLLRLSNDDAETLSVQYFDRSLPAYDICKGQLNIIYVQSVGNPSPS